MHVRAGQVVLRIEDDMHAVATERPAVVGREIALGMHLTAPTDGRFDMVARRIEYTQSARLGRKELAHRTSYDFIGFLYAAARLQQLTGLADQAELGGSLF